MPELFGSYFKISSSSSWFILQRLNFDKIVVEGSAFAHISDCLRGYLIHIRAVWTIFAPPDRRRYCYAGLHSIRDDGFEPAFASIIKDPHRHAVLNLSARSIRTVDLDNRLSLGL